MSPRIAEILQISEQNPQLKFEAVDPLTLEFGPETIYENKILNLII